VNLLDLALVAFAVLAGIGGYRVGLVARFLSWTGMAAGLVVASAALPSLVARIGEDNPRGRFVLATAVLLGGAFAGQALGLLLGGRANLALPTAGRRLDQVAGSFAGVFGVLVALWLLLPGLVNVPGELSNQALHSAIARFVNANGPPPPPTLQTLSRLVDATGIPQVFDDPRSAPDAGPPPTESGLPPAVLSAAAAATVRVESEACGRIQEGSGFVVDDGLIVTNAHVVAGTKAPSVVTPSGRRLPATLVHFDPDRDLALLRADTRLSPLALGQAEIGGTGAVLGYPGGGPLVVSPFKVYRDIHPFGRDLYDSHRTERHVLILASALRPGDSGAAVVNTSGQVVAVAFAIAPDNPNTAYALDRSELDAALAAPRDAKADAGRCLK
jgi:S1-C subfamily serine protease